uniref:Uncharacterized protein n=1 Tax=Oryza meridionalis TaxID=40149 RepID=A0A0E0EHQ2_9ORYZ
MALRILNSITRTKAEELFARERMGDGTAAATGEQEPEQRRWRWQSGGQEPRWLGANALLGDAGAAADGWAVAEHHRHPGSGCARRPCHGPTTRTVASAVAARLRAVLEAPRGPPPRGARRLPPPHPDVLAAAMSSRHPVHSAELLRVDYRLGLGQRRPRRQHHGRPWQAIHPPQPPFAAAAHQRLPARKPHIRPLRHQRRGGKSQGVRRAPSPPIIIPALRMSRREERGARERGLTG